MTMFGHPFSRSNKHDLYNYSIRFDFHFAPGMDVDAILSHYHASVQQGQSNALSTRLRDLEEKTAI